MDQISNVTISTSTVQTAVRNKMKSSCVPYVSVCTLGKSLQWHCHNVLFFVLVLLWSWMELCRWLRHLTVKLDLITNTSLELCRCCCSCEQKRRDKLQAQETDPCYVQWRIWCDVCVSGRAASWSLSTEVKRASPGCSNNLSHRFFRQRLNLPLLNTTWIST